MHVEFMPHICNVMPPSPRGTACEEEPVFIWTLPGGAWKVHAEWDGTVRRGERSRKQGKKEGRGNGEIDAERMGRERKGARGE